MNTSELKEEINKTLSELSASPQIFNQDNLNIVPFEGSWTGGQLIQHLILSNGGFANVMNGSAKETTRQFDQFVDDIKNSFLNFNIKMKSPEAIVPEFRQYQKDHQLKKLESIKEKINLIFDEKDLKETCTSFEVPVMGYLTRWESLHFILYHTQRHIRQLKNIFAKLNEQASIK
jgi:hypothetical protein